MALRFITSIFGKPTAPTPDPLLGAVLVLRRALEAEKKPLHIQRLLYIAQVEHIGRYAVPIFPDIFNASSLGPIVPRLMPLLKRRKAISDPIHETVLTATMIQILNAVAADFGNATAGQLVAVTHDDIGAWANYYTPGACRSTYTGRRIPGDALHDEYRARIAREHANETICKAA